MWSIWFLQMICFLGGPECVENSQKKLLAETVSTVEKLSFDTLLFVIFEEWFEEMNSIDLHFVLEKA